MGWGLTKNHRTGLLGEHYVPDTQKHTYNTVVVDMCSEARRVGSGPREQSARQLCDGLFRNLMNKCTGTLVIMFDCSERMHERRESLHLARYPPLTDAQIDTAAEAGKVVVGRRAFARGSQPYTAAEIKTFTAHTRLVWNRLWASAEGKALGWQMLYTALIVACHRHATDDHTCIMWLRGAPFVWPYTRDAGKHRALAETARVVCANTYGEADQRICEAARIIAGNSAPGGTMLVQTIDTDFLIQALCTPAWGDRVVLHLQLKNEKVDLAGMCRRFGGDAGRRINAAFWCLACGGVDYCKGLTRFGYKTSDLLACAEPGAAPPVIDIAGGCLALRTETLMVHLAALPRRKMKRAAAHDFDKEIRDMLFCVALFAGMASTREPCGGPTVPDAACFPGLAPLQPYNDLFVRGAHTGQHACHDLEYHDTDGGSQ